MECKKDKNQNANFQLLVKKVSRCSGRYYKFLVKQESDYKRSETVFTSNYIKYILKHLKIPYITQECAGSGKVLTGYFLNAILN